MCPFTYISKQVFLPSFKMHENLNINHIHNQTVKQAQRGDNIHQSLGAQIRISHPHHITMNDIKLGMLLNSLVLRVIS